MKMLAAMLGSLLVIAAPASRAGKKEKPLPEWARTLPALRPGSFPKMEPGEALYRFGWSGVTAAEATLAFSAPKPGLSRIDLNAQTMGIVRTLWRLDAEAFSVCDATELRPIRTRQIERYRKRTTVTIQEFAPGRVLRAKGTLAGATPAGFFDDRPADKEQILAWSGRKAKRLSFPELFDLQSALLCVRSQPLEKDDRIRLVVFQGNAPYLATLRVLGRETITVAAGRYPAIKMDLALRSVEKDFSLKPHGSFKRATGWFSDDGRRLLLKVEAEIVVGSVWAELARFTPSAPLPAVGQPRGTP